MSQPINNSTNASVPSYEDATNQVPSYEDATKPQPSILGRVATATGQAVLDNPISGPLADMIFSQGPYYKIAKIFGQSFNQNYGSHDINEDLSKSLQNLGVYNDYKDGKINTLKAVNEAWMRPVIAATVAPFQILSDSASSAYAGMQAVGAVTQAAGTELEGAAQTIQTAVPGSLGTALATPFGAAGELTGAVPEGFLPELSGFLPHEFTFAKARAEGVIGETEGSYMGTVPPTPEQVAGRNEAASLDAITAQEPVPDIHTVARTLSPTTFNEYDALSAQRDTFRTQLDDLLKQQPENPRITELRNAEQTILSKVSGNTDRLTNAAKDRLENIRTELESTPLTSDTPEMTELRTKLQQTDYRMRDLAPDVAHLYRTAQEVLGKPVEEVSGLEGTETPGEAKPSESVLQSPDEAKSTAISDDVSKNLTAAGRSEDEAKTTGAIVQALYDTHAARFDGRLGTADELYAKDQPEVTGSNESPVDKRGRTVQGKIAFDQGRKIITLFKTANASTFMHEIGHDWLNNLMRDAEHPEAPADVILDKAIVDRFLKRDPNKPLTVTMHEKWARTWERYLREGRAPSKELAGVFARFKNWLLQIYDKVSKLNAPITDDIKDVFARMFSQNPDYRGVTIAPDEETASKGPVTFKTAKGSIYQIHEDGTTTRNKAARTDAGHEGDSGVKTRTVRTIYVDTPENASQLSAAGISNLGPKGARVIIRDGKASLLMWNEKAEKWGISPGRRDIPISLEPGVGKAPLELWKPADDVPGYEAYSNMHAGNAITEISAGVTTPIQPEVRAEEPEPVATAASDITKPVQPKDSPATSQSPMSYNQSDYINKSGKINFDNISSDEQMNNFMKAYAEQNNNFVRSRGLGLTKSDIISAAEIFGTSARNMSRNLEKLKKLTVDSPVPLAVRVKALEEYLRQNTQRLMDAAHNDNPYEMAGAALKQLDAMRTFAGVKTSWAQVGHALQKANVEAKQGELINELLQNAIGRDFNQVKADMARIRQLDTPAKIAKYTKEMLKPSIGEMLLEGFKEYLISGPLTHMQYALGNKSLALIKAGPETFTAGLIGDIREKITGKTSEPGQRVYKEEAGHALYAYLYGQRDGLQAMWDAAKAGQTLPLPGEDVSSTPFTNTRKIPNFENVAGTGINVPLGSIIRIPGERMVAAIHSADRTIGYLTNRAALIYRATRDEGLTAGTPDFSTRMAEMYQDTPEAVRKEAVAQATSQALMARSGDLTNRILALTNWEVNLPVLGRTQPIGFISPFVPVASNINRLGLMERTPLGLWSKNIRNDIMGKNGTLAQDTTISKMVVGTAVWGTLGGLYYQNLINPAADEDWKKANVNKMTNGLPHSVQIGGWSYAFDRLGVYGMQMALGTDLWHAARYAKDTEDYQGAVTGFGKALWEHLTSEGFLSGVSDLMKAIEESDRYGESWKRNFFSTAAVPFSIGMSQIATQVDPYQRQARTLTDVILARIPFASESLQPKIDIFGQPVPNKEFIGVYAQQINDDPILKVMEQDGYFPAPVTRKIMGVPLTDEQWTDYATKTGILFHQLATQTINLPGFENLKPKEKHDLLVADRKQAMSIGEQYTMMKYRGSDNDIMDKAYKNKAGLVDGFK